MKNKNDVQAMLKEAGILFAITLIAGLLLGFVYELTKEPTHPSAGRKSSAGSLPGSIYGCRTF